jgi:hypothetical protein
MADAVGLLALTVSTAGSALSGVIDWSTPLEHLVSRLSVRDRETLQPLLVLARQLQYVGASLVMDGEEERKRTHALAFYLRITASYWDTVSTAMQWEDGDPGEQWCSCAAERLGRRFRQLPMPTQLALSALHRETTHLISPGRPDMAAVPGSLKGGE